MMFNSPQCWPFPLSGFSVQIWLISGFLFPGSMVWVHEVSGRLLEFDAAFAILAQPFWPVFETMRGWPLQLVPVCVCVCVGVGMRSRSPAPLVGMREPDCCLERPSGSSPHTSISSEDTPSLPWWSLEGFWLQFFWKPRDRASSSWVNSPRAENQHFMCTHRRKTLRKPYSDKQKISMDSARV